MRASILMMLLFAACDSSSPMNITKTVGTMGGTVANSDGSGVTIPSGALSAQAMITISSVNAPAPTGTVLVGPAYDFGPEGTNFSTPVTVTLPYDTAKIPAGRTTADIHIYTAARGSTQYTLLTTSLGSSTVSTQTNHFTTYLPAVPTVVSGGQDMATTSGCTPTCTSSGTSCGCTATCGSQVNTVSCSGSTSSVSCFCEINGQTLSSPQNLSSCSVPGVMGVYNNCFAGVSALDLRADGDRDLAAKLRADPEIAQRIGQYDREGGKQRARRQLLATALRLSPRSAPEIHSIVEHCRRTLALEMPFELYVYPDTRFNAACVRPEGGRLFVLFSSALFESFEASELRFVVGHELGHHLFDHHSIPASVLLSGEGAVSGPLALELYAWSRYAEISADRTGLVCAGDLQIVTSTLFKLASGLRRSDSVHVDVDELLSQAADMEAEDGGDARNDWFATHPFSPLRLKATQLFAASDLFVAGGTPRATLEAATQQLMTIMDPSYLTDGSDGAKAMRRFLFAGGVLVAAASGGISDEEAAALEKFLGPGSVDHVNPRAIREDLPRRIQAVKDDVPPLRRAQVIRDLCVIALADGRADPEERRVLNELAESVGVDTALVARILAAASPLD